MCARVAVPVGAALVVLAAAAAPASAGGWSLHVLGNMRTAWTDNLFSSEDDATSPPRESELYTQLIPGVLFTWETQRVTTEVFGDVEANLYADHTEAWSLTYRAGARAFFLTSPRSEASASVTATAGTLNTFSTLSTAATGEVSLLPSGANDFASGEARENFSYMLTRDLRVTQSAVARVFATTDASTDVTSTGWEGRGGLGADRSWQYNALGLLGQVSYVSFGDASASTGNQMSLQLVGSWRRNLGPHWSTLVDAGATALVPLSMERESVVQPTLGAQVGYYPEWGNAGLAVRRTVAPNLYISANTISDLATINAWLPLPWLSDDPAAPKLTTQGTLGYGRTSVLSETTGDALSTYDVATADFALDYAVRPQVHVALRYQYITQQAGGDSLMDVPSYDRNTVMLTFYGRWPERLAAEVPVRASLRVDRSDVTPVGDEGGSPGGGAGGAPGGGAR